MGICDLFPEDSLYKGFLNKKSKAKVIKKKKNKRKKKRKKVVIKKD